LRYLNGRIKGHNLNVSHKLLVKLHLEVDPSKKQ